MDIKIKIPTKLSDIKLKDFQRISDALENNPNLTDKELIAIYYDVDIKIIDSFAYADILEIITILKTVLETKEHELVRFTTIDNITFGFVPNLNEITYGEYLNITTYLKHHSTFHMLMANLYRPVVKKKNDLYEIEAFESTDKYSDIMKDVGLDVFIGAITFFLHLRIALEKHTKNSTVVEEVIQQMKK